MDDDLWQRFRPGDSEWRLLKESLPPGAELSGTVIAVEPFGLFLDLGLPAVGIMDIGGCAGWSSDAFRLPYDHALWPVVGDRIRGRVIWFRDNNHEIDLEWLR